MAIVLYGSFGSTLLLRNRIVYVCEWSIVVLINEVIVENYVWVITYESELKCNNLYNTRRFCTSNNVECVAREKKCNNVEKIITYITSWRIKKGGFIF